MARPESESPSDAASRRPDRKEIRRRVARILAELDEVELRIDRLVTGGEGFGRHSGVPIFVPFTTPGDLVRVRIVERRPDYGRGEVVEVLEPGAGRQEPRCRHFGVCGGCDLQHIEYDTQVRLKAATVLETLQRIGGFQRLVAPTVIWAQGWGYRRRAQWHTRTSEAGRLEVGYLRRGSRDLVAAEECPILVADLEAKLVALPGELQAPAPQRIDFAIGDDGSMTSSPRLDGQPHGEVAAVVGPHRLRFDSHVFFQGHRGLLRDLQRAVCGGAEGTLACDLFAGVGLYTLPLAERFGRVVAVESDRQACRFLRQNLRQNDLRNVDVVAKSVEAWLSGMPPRLDLLVANPPRTGLSPQLRLAIRASDVRAISYASCHPATMARDLRALSDAFELEALTILDLFPQSGHVEVVARLRSRSGVERAASDDSGLGAPPDGGLDTAPGTPAP